LFGCTCVGRAGSSALHNLGLAEANRTDAEPVRIACGSTFRGLGKSGGLRAGLRQKMQASPLMDAPPLRPQSRSGLPADCGGIGARRVEIRVWPHDLQQQLNSGVSRPSEGPIGQGRRGFTARFWRSKPNHADAWHLLGVLAAQTERLDAAMDLFRRAISICSTNALYHVNLGKALRPRGNSTRQSLRIGRPFRLMPNYAEAHFGLGSTYGPRDNLTKPSPPIAKPFGSSPITPKSTAIWASHW